MAALINPLKVTDNAQIMDAIRGDSSLEYQRRVPSATEAGITETVRALDRYKPHYNEFIDSLINRIGMVIARNTSWSNPLAEFKRGMLQYGDTIEEIQMGLLKAHGFDPDREYGEREIFGTERPDVQTNFHRVNRMEYYRITINETLLRRAFLEPGGLASFVTQMLEAPSTSDQWDEFQLTTSLFAKYESMGGFHHVNVPDVRDLESDGADSRLALRKMRAMAENLTFMSTKYNAAKMPVHAKRDDLVLFVSPEFKAAVDVEALAGAFNLDRANVYSRMIPIPGDQFRIDGAQAIMTTRDFFVIADQVLDTTSQFNPVSRSTNYFLHHQQVISASRFVPAVMFWTGADDEVISIQTPVTTVAAPKIEDKDGQTVTTAERGQLTALYSDVSPDGALDAVRWTVTGMNSPRTYITQAGVLHVAPDETATSVVVKAESTWIDPDNARNDPKSATATINLSGNVMALWPLENGKITGIEIAGADVPAVDSGTTTYALALPAGTTVKVSDVNVTASGSVDSKVTVTKVTGGYTVKVSIDKGTGAPVDYTVNVTVG